MSQRPYIDARYDRAARMWVGTSEDYPTLYETAPTLTKLCERLEVMIPELMEANGSQETRGAMNELMEASDDACV